MSNFQYGITAMSKEVALFLSTLVHNELVSGFLFGMILTLVIVGFILTKNPLHIPKILRYSELESFQQIAQRDAKGTYQMSYTEFIRMHSVIRAVFLIAFALFCAMIIVILLTQS